LAAVSPLGDLNGKSSVLASRSDAAHAMPAAPAGSGADGENISLGKSPAERLGLLGKLRAKAEKCLADAVYFEARGEPLRGQKAVAQVVMNRVFSGRYPRSVCGVVYQNAGHYLACQFTFACEGKNISRINDSLMWQQAKRIAAETLDGKSWLSDVGPATHYHALWVHPQWVRSMAKLSKLGMHAFYRPRAWGLTAPNWSLVRSLPTPGPGRSQSGEKTGSRD
jgi:spore germination cell wall hydrolase CwlJ-like protein